MKKRTDRAIAIASTAMVAVVPTVLLVVIKTGNGAALGFPDQSSNNAQAPSSSAHPAASKKARKKKASATPTSTYNPVAPANNNEVASNPKATTTPKKSGKYFMADDGAKITAVKSLSKLEFDITVRSPALGRSANVRILVPKSWTKTATKTWPVLYALHGGHDNYTSWTRSTDIEQVAAGYNTMVIMPEGASGGYTDWYNHGSGGSPKWETWHLTEVRQLVERNFHAGTKRAIMGMSSGGQGAMTYAVRHPGMFKYVSSYSGVLSMLSPGVPPLLLYVAAGSASDPTAIWGDPYTTERANWAKHDPMSLIKNLKGMGVYVSCGDGTEGPADNGAQDVRYVSEQLINADDHFFTAKAAALGIPMTVHYYSPGSHSWYYWVQEMHTSFPYMMKAIGAAKV